MQNEYLFYAEKITNSATDWGVGKNSSSDFFIY